MLFELVYSFRQESVIRLINLSIYIENSIFVIRSPKSLIL